MKTLVEKGAKIDPKNKDNETPLFMAFRKKHLEIVKILVEKGAKIDQKNKDNETPYIIAVKNGYKDVVDYLTNIKKRKAENQPREIFDSKDHTSI